MKNFTIPLAAVMLASAGSAYAQGAKLYPGTLYAKPGGSEERAQKDEEACSFLAKDAKENLNLGYVPPAASPEEALGQTIGLLIVGGIAQRKAQAEATRICMRGRGYAQIELTQAERVSRNKASTTAAQTAWINEFMQGDIAARVSADLSPKVPPLPSAKDDPFAIEGIVIDPESLFLESAPVDRRGLLISATARSRGLARVNSTVQIYNRPKTTVSEGETFRLQYPGIFQENEISTDLSIWCGQAYEEAALRKANINICIESDHDGYSIYLAHKFGSHYELRKPVVAFKKTTTLIELIELPSNPAEKIDVEIRPVEVSRSKVTLAATVGQGNQKTEIWTGSAKIDGEGKAIIPFWDRSLNLLVSGNRVTASWGAQEGGASLLEIK